MNQILLESLHHGFFKDFSEGIRLMTGLTPLAIFGVRAYLVMRYIQVYDDVHFKIRGIENIVPHYKFYGFFS